MSQSDNRRVAKNTLILYCRMVITMFIGLWTSRLVLNALGFTDQGLYNVVGGVVGMSSLIIGSIRNSLSRFITFEIGRGDINCINRAIQNAITVQWVLALVVVIAGETIGLWFVNHELVIPSDRMFAVNVVYQFSIANLAIGLLTSAPNAIIVAKERLGVFAGIAIVNSIVVLIIGIIISYSTYDRLILYAGLLLLNSLGQRLFLWIYIKKNFPFLKQKFGYDREVFKPIFAFAGWNAIGSSAGILRGSGTSILLNIFGGPIANTINGIAASVNNLATIFVSDFTAAYSPQIIKRYAAEEYNSLVSFLNQCAKISYSLIAVVAIPIMFNIEPLLVLWLKKIPDGVVPFAILIIICSMVDSLSRPLIIAKDATGDIRNYQIVVGGVLLLTIPITYTFLKLGFPIYYAYVSILITSVLAFVARMVMLKGSIPYWKSRDFIMNTVVRCLLATAAGFIMPTILHYTVPHTIISVLAQCVVGTIWCACCIFLLAMNKSEQLAVKEMIINKMINKFKRR